MANCHLRLCVNYSPYCTDVRGRRVLNDITCISFIQSCTCISQEIRILRVEIHLHPYVNYETHSTNIHETHTCYTTLPAVPPRLILSK
jgi:hypothetical protein